MHAIAIIPVALALVCALLLDPPTVYIEGHGCFPQYSHRCDALAAAHAEHVHSGSTISFFTLED